MQKKNYEDAFDSLYDGCSSLFYEAMKISTGVNSQNMFMFLKQNANSFFCYLEFPFDYFKDIQMLFYFINNIRYLTKDTGQFIKGGCAIRAQSPTFVI